MKALSHGQWLKLLHDRRFYMALLALIIDIGQVVFHWSFSPSTLVVINGVIAALVGGDSYVAGKHAAALVEAQAMKPSLVPPVNPEQQ